MQNARLPIELCELIIDYCYIETVESHHAEDWVVYPRYAALLACSLTCSDWLPRAHRNLYRHIWLRSSRTADLLERTLTSMPRLGPLVLELTVGARSTSNYISFARATFVRLLENIRYLHLHWMSQYHPPQYHRRLHPFPITELFIHFRSLETGYILGDLWLIWSLPELRSCDILFPYGPGRSEHFSRAVHMAETLIAQREESGVCICKNLHQLRLLTYMSYVWAGFLPKGAFGRSIRHLHVALGPLGVNVVPDYARVANCISRQHSLRKLSVVLEHIYDDDFSVISALLTSFLSAISSGSNFTHLSVELNIFFSPSASDFDRILTAEMKAVLECFPRPPRLDLAICKNGRDLEPSELLSARIRNWMPSLEHNIVITEELPSKRRDYLIKGRTSEWD